MTDPPTLDCQGCGEVIQKLTWEQQQAVAENPYNHVAFCRRCKQAGLHIEEQYR
ncbi:hypothetical protein BH762_gp005 [Gordonia phage OneUp]|uniref:Uncharacterized protein n=1 Tax=Gordonia phage OneUp TaxID=1838074 RepID=A0A160DEP8_9CAUD|nr:hypothetical protein BH762_gp005 [Gordonia phage OneUp]ANA86348.1 hypothetical protein PBI_ONEUP_5 [Gordonia phage OneUp]